MSKPIRQPIDFSQQEGPDAPVDPTLQQAIDFSESFEESFEPEARPPAESAQASAPPVDVTPVLRPRKRWGLRLAGVAALGILGIESWHFVTSQWASQPVLISCYTLLLGVAGIGAVRLSWREMRLLRRLRRQQQFQQDAGAMIGDGEDPLVATRWAEQVSRQLGDQLPVEGHEQYLARLCDTHNRQEVLDLFDHSVLSPLDSKAVARVRQWSGEAAVMVALSPLAALDMLLILWRNQKLIEDIASIYGVRLGYWSRIRLLRLVLVNIIYAGTSEMVTDLGVSALSADLTGRVSARMAQGLGAGLLTARLGLKCMQLCRPLAFGEHNRPRLADLRKGLISQLTQLMDKRGEKARR